MTDSRHARKRLLVSFSGGRTSGYMTRYLLQDYADRYEMCVVFANTGEEDERTLEFIRECDRQFSFGTVWIEAVQHHGERRSAGFRVVTFETASRRGEPFEDMIQKYGIPNKTHPHCTRSLKRRPIEAYMRSIGWGEPRTYLTAIGIRSDERRRVKDQSDRQVCYPLVDWFPVDKPEVNEWWSRQPFDLRLQEHEGNCRWCWKKSFRKHARLVREQPAAYDFPRRMEAQYGTTGAEFDESAPHRRSDSLFGPTAREPRVFFRENTSTLQLFRRVELLEPWKEPNRPDEDSGCSESCELFPTDGSDDELDAGRSNV